MISGEGWYCSVCLWCDLLLKVWVRFYIISSRIVENGSDVSIIVDFNVLMLLVSNNLVVSIVIIVF